MSLRPAAEANDEKLKALAAEFSSAFIASPVSPAEDEAPLETEKLMKAGRFISGETRLDHLVETVLYLLLQYAGADYGFLVFRDEEEAMAAEAVLLPDGFGIALTRESSVDPDPLRDTVAEYVRKTGKEIVVHDVGKDHRFAEASAAGEPAKSVLCLPLFRNGVQAGTIYLRNSRIPGAFTPNRLKTVGLLAAQAAVSLENASLLLVRKRLAEQREQLLRSEKLASLGVIAAAVAHEVNNPNHVIRMNAELLKGTAARLMQASSEGNGVNFSGIAEELVETARSIVEASERINSITNDIKGIARRPAERTAVDLNEVVESVLRLTPEECADGQRKPVLDLEKFRVPVRGDFVGLQQVVHNLLENAFQALDGAVGRVWLRTRAETDFVLLEVEDEGCGMTQDHLRRACEPFFTTRPEKGGTGLGLYVVESIAKDHGTKLEIESVPGRGTRVRLIFPKTDLPEAGRGPDRCGR